MNLAEKYRPHDWSEVVGQDEVIADLLRLRDTTGFGGNAFWLFGKPGQGKTSIARLRAAEVADCWGITEYDSPADLTPAVLADLARTRFQRGLGPKGGRAWILNEAHDLRADQQKKMLGLTEGIPNHAVWIFTSIVSGNQKTFDFFDNAGALTSRHHRYKLAETHLLHPFAQRAREIAQAEGLDGKPMSFYEERVRQNRSNLRAVIHEIQRARFCE